MAAELGWVGLGISPDFTDFKGKVERESSKVMHAAGVSGGEQFGTAAGQSAGSKFKSAIKSAAKVAAVGFAAAGALAIKFGGDALDEAREAQKVGALTTSTIKATGGAAKVTAKHVGDLSEKISEHAGIDDEVIQRGANMLLTFKNVRNEVGKGSKIFDRTTKAVTDMAAGMAGGKGGEIDLKSSAILMGKALNDPVKGLTAMSRVGIQFTDQQKAINTALVEGGNVAALNALGFQVTTADFNKAMEDRKLTAEETVKFFTGPMSDSEKKYFDHLAEGGHTLEAQKNILKEVNSQFKGAAAAQATDAEKLQVAWGNFKEEVGDELLPVMDDLARFLTRKGIPKAKEFFGWIKDTGVPAIKDLRDDLKPVVGYTKDLVGWLDKLPKDVKLGGLVGLAGLFGAAKLRGGKGGVLGSAGSALGISKPIPVLVTNKGFVGATGGGTTGGVVGADGKPKPGKTSRFKGAGNAAGGVAAALLGPWIVDQVHEDITAGIAEFDSHRFHGSTTKMPQSAAGMGGLGDLAGFGFDNMPRKARIALDKTAEEFRNAKLPAKLKTDIALNGVPESMRAARELVRQYDLTPKEKHTLFKLDGVGEARRQIDGLSGALANLANQASSGIDAAGATVVGAVTGHNDGRGRAHGRRRAIGGFP